MEKVIAGSVLSLGAVGLAAWALVLRKPRQKASLWLAPRDISHFVSKYETILMDCDGVIWRGDEPVEAVPDAINELQKMGKKVLFVSNNASKHRSSYLTKFKKMGINASIESVVTSASCAAQYFVTKYGKGAKVFVCGTEGLAKELEDAGATVVRPSYLNFKEESAAGPATIQGGVDEEIKAVVGGADWTLNYRKIAYGVMCLTNIEGCELIATNRDKLFPASDGRLYPGAGATIAPLENCSDKKAISVGKPGPMLLDILVESQGMDKRKTLMVGDRLDTDIEFGNNGGVDTLLVLTGVTKKAQGLAAKGAQVPNYMMQSFGDVHYAIESQTRWLTRSQSGGSFKVTM